MSATFSGCSDSIASATGFAAPPATITVAGLNPCLRAMIAYIPAGTSLNLNLPCASVTERRTLLFVFDLSSRLTAASGRPSASVMVPVIGPRAADGDAVEVAPALIGSNQQMRKEAMANDTINRSNEVAHRSPIALTSSIGRR